LRVVTAATLSAQGRRPQADPTAVAFGPNGAHNEDWKLEGLTFELPVRRPATDPLPEPETDLELEPDPDALDLCGDTCEGAATIGSPELSEEIRRLVRSESLFCCAF